MRWIRRTRWLIATCACALLLGTLGTVAQAGDPDLSWPPNLGDASPGSGQMGCILSDKLSWDSFISAVGWKKVRP